MLRLGDALYKKLPFHVLTYMKMSARHYGIYMKYLRISGIRYFEKQCILLGSIHSNVISSDSYIIGGEHEFNVIVSVIRAMSHLVRARF